MKTYNFSGEIITMGGINMDLVMFMDRMPGPGETVVTDNFHTFPGGKGGNQAVTAARLGGNVRFFGKLSNDTFSNDLLQKMQANGVDTSNILIAPEKTAGIAIIWVDKTGQNSIAFTPGANALLTVEEIYAQQGVFKPGAILLSSMETGPELVYAAIRAAKNAGMFTILDPAPAPHQPIPADIPALVDIIKPNETEAAAITGISVVDQATAEKALICLLEMGFSSPMITLGAEGVVAWTDTGLCWIKPTLVKPVDTTAAGDVFSGALAVSLSKGETLEQALRFATVTASLSTTKAGAQTSIPDKDEVYSEMR